MDLQKYLHRIGYENPTPNPTMDVLMSIHRCHLLTVPFENLTVHSGGRVQLGLPQLYNKIVNQRRGGFCYENNGLFSWLLSEIGFEVTLLAGQVRGSTGHYGPPFDHFISMVTLDGKHWLCDVGFGAAGFELPISLETSAPQKQGQRMYRIMKKQEMHIVEWQEEDLGLDEKWTEIYKFTLEARSREDFKAMCNYHQSSPCSIFFCKSLCSILRPTGRLTYLGNQLTTTQFPSKEGEKLIKITRELRDEEIPDILREEFGVVLQSPLIPKNEDITPLTVSY